MEGQFHSFSQLSVSLSIGRLKDIRRITVINIVDNEITGRLQFCFANCLIVVNPISYFIHSRITTQTSHLILSNFIVIIYKSTPYQIIQIFNLFSLIIKTINKDV